jgi:hypothetical protein
MSHSIYKTIKVKGTPVIIQANKNYGIINIEPKIDEVLTNFQGRQINDPNVIEHLKNVLFELFTIVEK